jgi:hypothetical protein
MNLGEAAASFAAVAGDTLGFAGAFVDSTPALVSIEPLRGGVADGATSAARTNPARRINDANGMRLMEVLVNRPGWPFFQ